MDDAAAVSDVLDDRPELESPLREVLDVDDAHEEWTFDDVPIDSGAFGELVSRGLVERGEDGYRVADPAAVRAALDGNGTAERDDGGRSFETSIGTEAVADRLASVDGRAVGALATALLAVVVARAYVYPSVFRDGAVVLSANDPYYYRYWVEQALVESGGVFDFSSLAAMSNAVQAGEPLLVAMLWMVSSLLGGDATAAGWVLAWYPVVAAMFTGLLVYLLAIHVTEDRRIGLAAVLLLAITPSHALRTSLGFADHHAFDYVWLMLTAYVLVRLETGSGSGWRDSQRWVWAGVLGLAIAGQILAWDAGALLVVPVGGYAAVRVLDDVRTGVSPLREHFPLVGGVGFGAVLVYVIHSQVGWHSTTVAFAPMLLAVGVIGVIVAGEVAERFDVGVTVLAGAEAVGMVLGVIALRTLRPEFWAQMMRGIELIARSDDIAETQSLLSGDAFGWLLLFGFLLVLAIPYLVWCSVLAYRGHRTWLVPIIYCWYFFGLAVFQVRFAGQLSMFAALFAGLGFVHLATVVDLAEMPVPFAADAESHTTISVPEWQTVGYLIFLFLLVGSLSFVQVPVKIGQITTSGDAYQTATWMDEYADEQGLEYPENYVFSQWGENRMYNYFVNGESRSYGFAQNNFAEFAAASDGETWYQRLRDRVGFIVIENQDVGSDSIYGRLASAYGGQHGGSPGLSHYRAVYESDAGRTVYTLVPGATVTGNATSETEELTVETDVELGDSTFTYSRRATTEHGVYTVTVPYPGTYTIDNRTFHVSDADVQQGATYETFDGPGLAHWSFDEGEGAVAYDRWGGNHMRLEGVEWTDRGVEFRNGSSTGTVNSGEFMSVDADESLTIQITLQGDLSESPQTYPTVFSADGQGQVGIWARNDVKDFGVRITDNEGDHVRLFDIERRNFESPTTVTVVIDRDTDEVRLYADGSLAGKRNATELGAVNVGNRVVVGTGWDPNMQSSVVVSDLAVYNSSRMPNEIESST